MTELGSNDSHFIEGSHDLLDGQEVKPTPRHNLPSRTLFIKEPIRVLMKFPTSGSRGSYGTTILSYRDRAYPREDGSREIFIEHSG